MNSLISVIGSGLARQIGVEQPTQRTIVARFARSAKRMRESSCRTRMSQALSVSDSVVGTTGLCMSSKWRGRARVLPVLCTSTSSGSKLKDPGLALQAEYLTA